MWPSTPPRPPNAPAPSTAAHPRRPSRRPPWAHMLGFSGHFSTKSRAYSTTLGALRADRAQYRRELAIAAGFLPEPAGDAILVLSHWSFNGRRQPPVSLRRVTASGPGRAEHPDPPPGGDGPWT